MRQKLACRVALFSFSFIFSALLTFSLTPPTAFATHTLPQASSLPVGLKNQRTNLPASVRNVTPSVSNTFSGATGVLSNIMDTLSNVVNTVVRVAVGTVKSVGNSVASVGKWVFARKPSADAKDKAMVLPTSSPKQKAVATTTNQDEIKGVVLGVEDDLSALEQKVAVLATNLTSISSPSFTSFNSSTENMLRNSSFEAETSGGAPRQWNYQLDSTTGTTFRSNESIHSGSHSLKFKGGGTGNFGLSQPDVKTTPQRTYTLSTFIKVINAPSITVKIGFWDEKNNTRGNMKEFTFSGTKEWSRINMTTTTTGLITDSKNWFPLIEVLGLTSGNVYIDDAKLEEGTILTTYNSIVGDGNASSSLGDGSILGSADGNLFPSISGVGSLGSSDNQWEDLHISDDANIGDSLVVNGNLAANGDTITSDSNLTINATGYVRIGSGDNGTPDVAVGSDDFYVVGNIENDGNVNIAGTLTVAGGSASTLDTIDLTPSTNIDAVDITGTNITTADLIDLDATATTTGDAIDINMANTRTSGSALLVTDAAVAATVTGDLFQINVTGTKDTNTLDIDVSGSSAASGNEVDITYSDAAHTGNAIDVNMGTNLAGYALDVQGEGARTAPLIFINGDNTDGGTDDHVIDIDQDGVLNSNVLDITYATGASDGNAVDLNMGTNVAGDALNIASAATTGNGLVITNTSARTSGSAISVADSGNATASDPTVEITATAITDVAALSVTTAAQTTGDTLSVDAGASVFTTGSALNVIGSGAYATDDDAALLNVVASGIATDGHIAAIVADSATTVDSVLHVSGNGVNTGQVLNFDATGLTTGQALDITATSTHTADAAVSPVVLALTNAQSTTATTNYAGVDLQFTNNPSIAANTEYAMRIQNQVTANTTDNAVAALLILDNADTSAGGSTVVTDGLLITNSGNIAGGITNAINIDDTDVTVDIILQNDERIANDTDGTVLIDDGTTTLISTSTTTTSVNLSAQIGGTAQRLCHGGADASAGVEDVGDCGATQADLAEYYGVIDSADSGDVMVLSGSAAIVDSASGSTSVASVKKSSVPYEGKIIGVISTNPSGEVLGEAAKDQLVNPKPIALVGRVPVKVSGENGPIFEGDYLTSSSTPGYAMKSTQAGPVVGMALESFDGDTGTIVVYVKATWYDPLEAQKQAILASLGVSSSSVLGASDSSPVTTADSSTVDTLGVVQTPDPLTGPSSDGSLGVLAEEVDLKVHGLLTTSNLVVTQDAAFDRNLTVKGSATFEGDLIVKGLFATGTLEVSGAVVRSMTAGGDISAGDPVVVSGSNTVVRAGSANAAVVGLAANNATAGATVPVAVAGTVGGYSNLAVGSRYYVGAGGTVTTTAPAGSSAVHVGIAVNDSEMIVQIFAASVPEAASTVVDEATVDEGPTVVVETPTEQPTPVIEEEVVKEPTVEPESTPEPTLDASDAVETTTTVVTVNDTELGFLRVRADSNTESEELGRVTPGQEFAVLAEENGWYSIEYSENELGWIAGNYVTVNTQ